MSDKNNTLLYRCPGTNKGPQGRTYDWASAETPEQVAALVGEGWSLSLEAAIALAASEEPASGGDVWAALTTPTERAAAADKMLAAAAERVLDRDNIVDEAKKRARGAETDRLAALDAQALAHDALAKATEAATAADEAVASATRKKQGEESALSLARTRAEAARKALSEASERSRIANADKVRSDEESQATSQALADAAKRKEKKA